MVRHLAAACGIAAGLIAAPALAQQGQEWFVPGQGQRPQGQQQRPQQAQPQQRQQQQRRTTEAPPPLPPGQQPPAAVIGIVDVPEIQRVSGAFNQVREEIERRRARLNDDLQREQGRWREEQQRLANERASLSPEQLRSRERDLQERITDAQRIFRDRSRGIEQAAQQALAEIEQALGTIIRQVASSRNVNLILPRGVVIFNEPPFDLTEEIAQQLNRAVTSVTLPPEEGAPQAGQQPQRPAQQPQRPAQQQGQQGQRRN
jgi:Skp family chaperone for outer membrane proteins